MRPFWAWHYGLPPYRFGLYLDIQRRPLGEWIAGVWFYAGRFMTAAGFSWDEK